MASIEEIAQAEKEYADVNVGADRVEFVDKSLFVCCTAIAILPERLIDIGYSPAALSRNLIECAAS